MNFLKGHRKRPGIGMYEVKTFFYQLMLMLMMFVLSAGTMVKMSAEEVYADTATDTITIKIGYLGWTEDMYITKGTYHWTELDDQMGGALYTYTQTFSRIKGNTDRGNLYLVRGRGFSVRDLFEYANMDFNSIASVNFTGSDGWKCSFNYSEIFGSQKRYYFPNLASTQETGPHAASYNDDVWYGAVQVEPMLALEDYAEAIDDPDLCGFDFDEHVEANESLMNAGSRFHLVFGQASPEESRTSSLTKYCNSILVLYRGKPMLTADETNIEMKVGSGHKIEVAVDAEENSLNEYVKNNILWSSSDSSIATVDENGNVSMVGKGEAVITAAFGESSVSVVVSSEEGEEEADPSDPSSEPVNPDPEPQPEKQSEESQPAEIVPVQTGSGTGSDTGSGTGSGGSAGGMTTSPSQSGKQQSSSGSTTASPSETASQQPSETVTPKTEEADQPDSSVNAQTSITAPENKETESVTGRKMFAINPEVLGAARAGDDYEEDASGGKMDDDSQQLKIKMEEPQNYALLVGGAAAAALLMGAGLELLRFRILRRGSTRRRLPRIQNTSIVLPVSAE